MNCPHHPNTPGLVYCPECRAAEEEPMVAPLVKAFSQTMDANFTQSKEKPKLRKLIITITF